MAAGASAPGAGGRRILAGVLATGVVLATAAARTTTRAPHGDPQVSPTAVEGTQAAPAPTEGERFVALLDRVRAGDDDAIPGLRACAERRATAEGRPDVRAVAEFFAAMPREARVRGRALEARWLALRDRVRAATTNGLSGEAWRDERARILDELGALAREAETGPDVTPAARALSLAAYLRSERVAVDRTFAPEEKRAWIEAGGTEAARALELFERAGMGVPRLEPLEALAEIELAREHRDEAADLFAELRSEGRRLGQRRYEAKGLVGLARLAHEAGDLYEAGEILSELSRLVSPTDDWELAKRQGQYLLAIDEPGRAAEFLSAHRPRERRAETEWHVLMEGALVRSGDATAAGAHVDALKASSGDAADPALAALARADAAWHGGDVAAAKAALEGIADPRALPPRLYADHQRMSGSLDLACGDARAAIACFERALETGDSLEARLGGEAKSPTASVIGESIGLETVALLARALISEGRAFDAAVVLEDRQSRALRTAVARARDDASASDEPERFGARRAPIPTPRVTPDVLKSWAAAYEQGLVTWVIGADTSVVVHVGRDGSAVGAVIPYGRTRVADAVRRLREAAITDDAARATELGTQIESVLLPAAVTSRFETNPSSDEGRVLLSTHGPIDDLPFALLPAFSDVRSRRLVPVRLPGLPESARGPAATPAQLSSWSVLGDPIDAHGRSLLPGAAREVAAVAGGRAGVVVHSGQEFGAEALREALVSERCLHLATHLRIDDGDRPGAAAHVDVLAGSRFASAAFELSHGARFDVDSVRRAAPRLPLAFLSACETGSGQFVDAQASLGMVRAFLESGTRNLIVTAWPVEDGAAQRFAAAFHAALARGKSPARAAVHAREMLRQSGAPPADWAAFALVGRD